MTLLSGVIWAIQDGHYLQIMWDCSITPFNMNDDITGAVNGQYFMAFMSITDYH